jgi:[ribosomal protein S5]-alanine N-acetyltransferase
MSKATNEIVFETERLFVRPYTMDDLHLFFRLNGDEEVMRYIRPAQTLEQSKEFLQKIIADYIKLPGKGRWGMFLKEDNHFIGSFAIIPVDNTDKLQLGYALTREYWGNGFASESVRRGIQYAFGKLDLVEIAGITFAENIPSQKVLLKSGFVFDKTFIEEGKEMHLYICSR